MGIPHGLFNKSDQPMKCLFWVTPPPALYDLFWAIHSMKEQKPEEVVALAAKHEVCSCRRRRNCSCDQEFVVRSFECPSPNRTCPAVVSPPAAC